jgi:NADH-quinone oxidoreductase subunit L
MELMIKLIVLLPLISAVFIGLRTRHIGDRLAHIMSCVFISLSAVMSLVIFVNLFNGASDFNVHLMRWIDSGDFVANWSLKVDMLTAVMLIVVTSVSTVVHIYSVGYMSHDEHQPRFMAYLSLFTFCMLMLVTADNFVQLFFGWEGVGLSSYLLIGFWFHKDSANNAAMKAFIVNRVGDVGLALGIALIFLTFGSVNFAEVFADLPKHQTEIYNFIGIEYSLYDIIGLLLFIGCMGKSAQFLLHTWLPDAMEGPTPVSALIHAATMVTAGVFLLARCSHLYEYAPFALDVITFIGALTALFAASVGLVQNDIKRVIAYSTCSQLGYMFFACGVGAYSVAIFHLMTHAFFKALLFLGAGSVIHAMSDEQDLRNMGGIWRKIPYTYALMWLGSLALAGIPPLAGYYSKDLIIEAAYAADGRFSNFAFYAGIGAAFLTAFYSGRLLFMAFHGKPRCSKEVYSHVHESSYVMLLPLIILVIGTVASGIVGYHIFGIADSSGSFWRGVVATGGEDGILEKMHHIPSWVAKLPLVMALFGIALSWFVYVRSPKIAKKLALNFAPIYKFLLNKWFIDELYKTCFVKPSLLIGSFFWHKGDEAVINRFGPDGISRLTYVSASALSRFQNGLVNHYATVMIFAVVLLLFWLSKVGLGL